jgi:transcription antitermination factor NusG
MSVLAQPTSADQLWLPAGGESASPWHLLLVKSRQEKQLSQTLASMGVPHFLPLVRRARYWGARKAVVEDPLFPGYLFLRGALDDVYRADRTRRVARVVPVVDQKQIDWELRNIRMALASDAVLQSHPYLSNGTRVEVRCGPFRGLQGVVRDRGRENRLILQVRMLGTATSLEIDAAMLDPVA